MKKIFNILAVSVFLVSCLIVIGFSCSPGKSGPGPQCLFEVYQGGWVINKVCNRCSFASRSGNLYYKNTGEPCGTVAGVE